MAVSNRLLFLVQSPDFTYVGFAQPKDLMWQLPSRMWRRLLRYMRMTGADPPAEDVRDALVWAALNVSEDATFAIFCHAIGKDPEAIGATTQERRAAFLDDAAICEDGRSLCWKYSLVPTKEVLENL